MRKELTEDQWGFLNHEVNQLLGCLWYLARIKVYKKAKEYTGEESERVQHETFEITRMEGWDRLIKIKRYLQKLELPTDQSYCLDVPLQDDILIEVDKEKKRV